MIVRIAILFFVINIPVQAAPRWLTATPRAVGRAYSNMFTFKNKTLAVEQWATFGALIFDHVTTQDAFHRCSTCVESGKFNFYRGRRYNWGTSALDIALAGTEYVTLEQYGQEVIKNDPKLFWRDMGYSVAAAPIIIHVQAGVHNMGVR